MKRREDIVAFLGKHTELKGNFEFHGMIRLDGRFAGNIKGERTLIIGMDALVEAEIEVPYVVVMGELKGNIHASEKVVIHSKAKVYGDIQCPRLSIEEGGVFHGRCLGSDTEKIDEKKLALMSSKWEFERVDLRSAM